jgi:undecaprenyl-diphosphatase
VTYLQAIISGLVQGLTEFLPVSSSGHLVLLHHFLGIKSAMLVFDICLHVGTLFAVILFFWKKIIDLFKSNRKKTFLLLVAMIPASLAALFFEGTIESFFNNPSIVIASLVATGIWLIIASWGQKNLYPVKKENANWFQAIMIGLAQAFALIPGISRSGATISTGLLTRLNYKEAVTFSFLLSILAISAALLFKIRDIAGSFHQIGLGVILSGTITSFIFGLLAIKIVFEITKKQKLHYFGIYCIAIGFLYYIIT